MTREFGAHGETTEPDGKNVRPRGDADIANGTSSPGESTPKFLIYLTGPATDGEGPRREVSTTGTDDRSSLEEESPWVGKTLLSLDGGGVRGLLTLYILRRLVTEIVICEKKMNPDGDSSIHSSLFDPPRSQGPTANASQDRSRRYLLCHYFDYICGTSTGGLIAIMLGRLKLDLNDAIDLYMQLSSHVFEKPPSRLQRLLSNYSSEARRRYLKNLFDDLAEKQGPPGFQSDPLRCRTLVCLVQLERDKAIHRPVLFRSYEDKVAYRDMEWAGSDTPAITDVARAVSAAPPMFKPVELRGEMYFDAGVNLNNPSLELLNEVGSQGVETIDLLLSVGGGGYDTSNLGDRTSNGGVRRRAVACHSLAVDQEVRARSKSQGFQYYRLDAGAKIRPDIRLDEWKPKRSGEKTRQRIDRAMAEYLSAESVTWAIQDIAHRLVRRRIRRSRTMRWESFASGTRYKCPFLKCPLPSTTRFLDRNELMDHLRIKHDQAPPDADHYERIKTLLDKGRTGSVESNRVYVG